VSAADQRLECEWVDIDGRKNVFAAEGRGKEIEDGGEERVAAEFPGMTLAFAAESLGELCSMLAGLAGKNGGAAETVDDAGNRGQGRIGIAFGPLQVARELRAGG
jgi:hypothetical protein